MPQLAAATKPHDCCLFAAIHCEKPLISIRDLAYSDALKNSFFPRTIPMWNSLPSSVVSSKTIEEFKAQIKIIGTEVCDLACLCTASCK